MGLKVSLLMCVEYAGDIKGLIKKCSAGGRLLNSLIYVSTYIKRKLL